MNNSSGNSLEDSEYSIIATNLSKRYSQNSFGELLNRLTGKIKKNKRDFLALRKASFKVKKGESVGIIGKNGSGKSTILQIISGTLKASSGSYRVRGKMAALLELGSGFNPEFTGLENVFFNASILGFDHEKTSAVLDDIISFADIGDFIEKPVRTYSSGMKMRLAFAVQVHVEPDILIIDEALGVGDQNFRVKCYNKIDQLLKKNITFLLVSHNQEILCNLTKRALVLDQGKIVCDSNTPEAMNFYNDLHKKDNFDPLLHDCGKTNFNFINHFGQETTKFQEGEDIIISIKNDQLKIDFKELILVIRNKQRILIYERKVNFNGVGSSFIRKKLKIKGCLARNIYSLQVLIYSEGKKSNIDLGTNYLEVYARPENIKYSGICNVEASII
jgi:ABC-type polysaccharide/polyol phosphate transport system ATPase subunit